MKRKYFGTDGIRGKANQFPMDPETVLKIGMAAGTVLRNGGHRHSVVIGKDTRLSGYMIESALTAGFNAVGVDVFLVGPIPTPGVAMLTRSLRCDLGVVVSASHNPFMDNGIKFFDSKGIKFPEDLEEKIEKTLGEKSLDRYLVDGEKLGRAKRSDNDLYQQRYIEFLKSAFPKSLNLKGLKIVVDCAHGAAYKIAPTIFWELGADVTAIGSDPNGFNINDGFGSTDIEALKEKVLETGADIGIALDGDADRVIIVDEKGDKVDGDKIIALIAKKMLEKFELNSNTVVVTQMSNFGFEKYMNSLGIQVIRTNVGDRYVAEEMRKNGFNLGGEQSGHIIIGDYSTTGDGTLVALQVLALLCRERELKSDRRMSEICDLYDSVPQKIENIQYHSSKKNPLDSKKIQSLIDSHGKDLTGFGRVFVRKSGTQDLIRVMVECDNRDRMEAVCRDISDSIRKEIDPKGGRGPGLSKTIRPKARK